MPDQPAAPQFADVLSEQLSAMHNLVAKLADENGFNDEVEYRDAESELLAAVAGTVVLLARWAIALDKHWTPDDTGQTVRTIVPPPFNPGPDAVTFLEPKTEGE